MSPQTQTPSTSSAPSRPHYGSILVVIDDQPAEDAAVAAAVRIARQDHAILTFLYVVPDYQNPAVAAGIGGVALGHLLTDPDAAARRSLNAAVARTPADIGVRTCIVRGRRGRAIIAHAAQGHYDAIVMTAPTRRPCGFWAGHAYVQRHARIPVLIAESALHQPSEPVWPSDR